jgi:lipoate-protein ligase A
MNMGIDDALLEAAVPGAYTVRFYRWLRPTVSLGYAQTWQSGFEHSFAMRQGIGVVRRRTGGRAVLHAGELTYSVTGDAEHGPLAGGIQATYSAIAEGLVVGLARLGVGAEVVRSRGRRERREPGACFGSRALHEIVAGGGKLIGSAQRRASGRALQHGSILLEHPDPFLWRVLGPDGPPAASESIGLFELVRPRPAYRQLCGHLAAGLAARLGATWAVEEMTRKELRRARAHAARYADQAFTRRR